MRAVNAHMPDHWWFLPIRTGNVRVASFFGLMSATSAAEPISAPMTIDSWIWPQGRHRRAVAHVDARRLVFPTVQVKGDLAAVARSDAAFAERYYAGRAVSGSILGSPGTDFLWAGGRAAERLAGGSRRQRLQPGAHSRVPTLVISGDLDVATPPQTAARELLPHLPNGRQVVLPNLGHTDDFWAYEPAASSHLVNTFLSTGKVDSSRYTTGRVDFTPGMTQTRPGPDGPRLDAGLHRRRDPVAAGAGAPGAQSRTAGPHRERRDPLAARPRARARRLVRRRPAGAHASCRTSRSTATSWPASPSARRSGSGIYWAWVHRTWSRRTRTTGLAAALAGSLVGAWLGYNATTELFAVLTAIAGAAVGGNLVLLGLDVARDRVARDEQAYARRNALSESGTNTTSRAASQASVPSAGPSAAP